MNTAVINHVPIATGAGGLFSRAALSGSVPGFLISSFLFNPVGDATIPQPGDPRYAQFQDLTNRNEAENRKIREQNQGNVNGGSIAIPPDDGLVLPPPFVLAKNKTKAKTSTTTSASTTSKTCDPKTDKNCGSQKHSGRIQGQEGSDIMLATAAGSSAWTDLPEPPSLSQCTGYANACLAKLQALSGSDRGKEFQKGALLAHTTLVAWMTKSTPSGVDVPPTFKRSFYFDGTHKQDSDGRKQGKDSRRMDFDVLKGAALKSY